MPSYTAAARMRCAHQPVIIDCRNSRYTHACPDRAVFEIWRLPEFVPARERPHTASTKWVTRAYTRASVNRLISDAVARYTAAGYLYQSELIYRELLSCCIFFLRIFDGFQMLAAIYMPRCAALFRDALTRGNERCSLRARVYHGCPVKLLALR